MKSEKILDASGVATNQDGDTFPLSTHRKDDNVLVQWDVSGDCVLKIWGRLAPQAPWVEIGSETVSTTSEGTVLAVAFPEMKATLTVNTGTVDAKVWIGH